MTKGNRQDGRHYVTVMPNNLYGPNDNFDLETSHVLPALLRKAHEAKLRSDKAMAVWGSGRPRKLLDVSRVPALQLLCRAPFVTRSLVMQSGLVQNSYHVLQKEPQ